MSTREDVLARIRSALPGDPGPSFTRRYRVADGAIADVELFVDRLRDYRAVVHEVSLADLAAMLQQVATGRVVVPDGVPTGWLAGIDVVRDVPLMSAAELDRLDAVLTTCALAIAETGTIVLDGGPGQGRRALTLVPDHHVVVVRADQVVATVPQAITGLDPRRPQTWVSGPSATSDIELQRVEGVHGPRRLDVVLVVAGG
ncbi:MAG: L-lactate dehydrogenase complex protein LldG [Actinomycetota bacterium]|jgi:L-lactate dehydrogenase complex protein LldG|nr:L-lactate dehydrogenase complex protein LldG [Actinomycetota bacterium]